MATWAACGYRKFKICLNRGAAPAIVTEIVAEMITLALGKCSRTGAVLERWRTFRWANTQRAGLQACCFRRRVVRNDGEDRRLAGSRSLDPTPADALSVVPASPSPGTGEDGSRGNKKNMPSGFGADWSHCKRSRVPGTPAELSRSTARYKPVATAIAELTAPPKCSCP